MKKILLFFVKYLLSRIILLVFFLGLFIGGTSIGFQLLTFLKTPLNVNDVVTIDVASGMNIDRLAERLQKQNIISNANYLKWYARFTGQAGKLKVGEYSITKGMLPSELLSAIVSGKSVQYHLTIVEGWTFDQVRDAIQNNPNIKHTIDSALSNEEVMTLLGLEGKPYEGYFLPETYLFPKDYTDVDLLKRSYSAMASVVDKIWEGRDINLPIKTKHELLTLASIVEKETGVVTERSEIAGVFVRRLQKNMRLQTDPTVIYGLGKSYRGKIYRSDLEKDTPFNTYTRDGLPPTPIAMPSVAAIFAAANPKEGKSLYFVAKGDGSGEHIFSNTLDEHNKAVRAYRARLNQ